MSGKARARAQRSHVLVYVAQMYILYQQVHYELWHIEIQTIQDV